MKKVTNKSMSKLAVKFMRHRGTPDLRPKFDLILWPGWVNPKVGPSPCLVLKTNICYILLFKTSMAKSFEKVE